MVPVPTERGTSSYNDKCGLPLDVHGAIPPVRKDLCKRENLSKWLHGRTQNRNKNFSGIIWNRIPRPVMWVLLSLVWVFIMLLPILMMMQLHPQRLRIYKRLEHEASWPHDEGFTNPERVSQGTCSIPDV